MKKPIVILLTVASLLLIPTGALADEVPAYDFATPVFGLTTPAP